MSTIDFIRQSMDASRSYTMRLLMDLRDAPIAQPTANGGNHALWIIGHLACIEGMVIQSFMLAKPNPLSASESLFQVGTEPIADASKYPSFDQLVTTSVRRRSSF